MKRRNIQQRINTIARKENSADTAENIALKQPNLSQVDLYQLLVIITYIWKLKNLYTKERITYL
jgi:hypothetical protein